MEIINTAARRHLAISLGAAVLLGSTSLFASDLVLHKVPLAKPASDTSPEQSTEASDQSNAMNVGFVAANRVIRPLYVSSGSDIAQAASMLDDQVATSYTFAPEDASPTAVVDFGETAALRRLSVVYAPRAVKVDFYVLQAMPNAAAEGTPEQVNLDDATLSRMKSVASTTDDGSLGRATVEFAPTTGRYVMVRWTPTAQQDAAFTVAEISAVSAAQSRNIVGANRAATAGRIAYDGKTALDGKTMLDGKEMMPGEGPAEEAPESPGEGPPPTLPQPPPFAFVPILVPVSP